MGFECRLTPQPHCFPLLQNGGAAGLGPAPQVQPGPCLGVCFSLQVVIATGREGGGHHAVTAPHPSCHSITDTHTSTPALFHGCNARGLRRSTAPAPAASRGPSSSLPSPYQAIAPLPWGLPNPARASRSTETVKLSCSHSGCSSKPPGELLKRPRPSPHCQRCFHRCWRRPRYVRF